MDDTDIEKMYNDSRFTKWQQKFMREPVKPVKHCSRCNALIPLNVLIAAPNTAYCSRCQREIDKNV